MDGREADVRRSKPLSLVGQAVLVVGLVVVAVSFVLPFASNEAGCWDHCAGAGRYFVWNPLHNLGAPFLLAGVGSSVLLWRSPRWRRRVVAWVVAFSGWIGLYLYARYAPAVIEELYLYGGPALELRSTRWIVVYGYLVLQAGTLLHAQGTAPLPVQPVRMSSD